MDNNDLAACRAGLSVFALLLALYFHSDIALTYVLALAAGALIPVQHIAEKVGGVIDGHN